MDPARIPRQLLASIQAAPKPGIGLLFALVDQGVVSVFDPVDEHGARLLDVLINGALHGTQAKWHKKEELFAALFAPGVAGKWLDISDRQAFAGRDEKGAWVVQGVMEKLRQQREALKDSRTRPSPAAKKEDPWSGRGVDGWLAQVLPTLPAECWKEAGAQVLSYALQNDLPATTDIAWARVSVLSPDHEGNPVLLSARHGRHWDRFLQEGGNPAEVAGNAPIWKRMLDRVNRKPPMSEDSLIGRFEAWFLASAPQDAQMRPHLKSLVFHRAAASSRATPAQWVKLFEAAGPEALFWKSPKEQACFWHVAALSHPNAALFDAIERSPALFAAIPRPEFEMVRFLSLAHQLSTAVSHPEQKEALERLVSHVEQRGMPVGMPLCQTFAVMGLPKDIRTPLRAMADGHAEAWWGAEDRREQDAKQIALSLPGQKSAVQLDTWIEMVTGGETLSPWLSVGLGVACAARNRMEVLEGVPAQDIGAVYADAEGRHLLLEMGKRVQPRTRAHYLAWLESAALSAAAPLASAPRRGMRL